MPTEEQQALLARLEEVEAALLECAVFETPELPPEPEPEPEVSPAVTAAAETAAAQEETAPSVDPALAAALEKQASLTDHSEVTFGNDRLLRQSWSITNTSAVSKTAQPALSRTMPKRAKSSSQFLLRLTIHRAEELKKSSAPKHQPVQVVFSLRDGEKYTTRPKPSHDMRWNETFEIELPSKSNNKFSFELWRGQHELIGKAAVVVENLSLGPPEELAVPLFVPPTRRGQTAVESGKLTCTANAEPLEPSMAKLLDFVTGNKFIQHSLYDLIRDTEQDTAAFALLDLCNSRNVSLPLLIYAVEKETSQGSLGSLQQSSILRKMLGMFTKYARESYLEDYIQPTIRHIQRSGAKLEIRSSKLSSERMVAANKATLLKYAQEIMDTVVSTAMDMPFPVKLLCQQIHTALQPMGSDAVRETLGDLLFQRFICPAIVSPKAYGLLSAPPTAELKQGFVLLAKVLSNAAINRAFPASNELAIMNSFIAENSDAMERVIAAIFAEEQSGISSILASKKQTEEFYLFLKKLHSEENLQFYTEIIQYRALPAADRPASAQNIYNNFIAAGALNEVNLDSAIRKKIAGELAVASAELFDEAHQWVYHLLSGDCYVKFLQAPRRPATAIGSSSGQTLAQCATKLCKFLVEHMGALEEKAEARKLEEYIYSVNELSKLLSALSEDHNPTKGVKVMNRVSIWSGKVPRPAWPVAADCLQQIISLFRTFFADGTVTDETVRSMRSSAEFKNFAKCTSELQAVNVEYLSHNQKLAFWINTFNTMALHAYVEIGQPSTLADWVGFQQQACYEVAGNVYNMLQVEHSILRAQMSPAKWLKGTGGAEKFLDSDPQVKSALQKGEKLLCFTLCNGALQNPIIRVYHPGMSQKEIVQITSQHLVSNVSYDNATKELSMPKVLYWYYKDFCNDKKKAYKAVVDGLLIDTNRMKLMSYLRNKPKFVFEEDWSFRPIFLD
mmetsp:Transcript_13183/g.52609  ORF Transcript_13183/g.52609 Transcript_13183/m.52609 type:complete len:959 (-) Transcript_13183:41-2917(-)